LRQRRDRLRATPYGVGRGFEKIIGTLAAVFGLLGSVDEGMCLLIVELVATSVLGRRPLDVGDPIAVLAGIGDRLPPRNASPANSLRLVEEPVELLFGIRRVAGVLIAVPQPKTHLEEAKRVAIAA
jgi:hypothetical protein